MRPQEKLIESCNKANFHAKFRDDRPNEIVCKRVPNNIGGVNGLSFLMAYNDRQWLLCCWSYRYWLIPNDVDVSDVAIAYLEQGMSISKPPDTLVCEFRLVELDHESLSKHGFF